MVPENLIPPGSSATGAPSNGGHDAVVVITERRSRSSRQAPPDRLGRMAAALDGDLGELGEGFTRPGGAAGQVADDEDLGVSGEG
jgi:hypothetical protein